MTRSSTRWMYLVLSWLLSMGVQAQPLRIGTWDQKSDTLIASGEAILAYAYAELKQPVEFVELPARRAMVMMLNGGLDGNVFRIAELAHEQPSLYRVETPITATEIHAYGADAKIPLNQWSQLDGRRVGFLRGTLMIERNLPAGAQRVEASSVIEMFRLFQRGAFDVVVMGEPLQSKPHPLARAMGAVRLDGVLETVQLYHYLRMQHKETGVRLSAVLKRMATSGEMQEIRNKANRAFE